MNADRSATNAVTTSAWACGLAGVLIFSGSLPATRAAVADFDPLFLTTARAVIAALIGLALVVLMREHRPARRDFLPLAIVAAGVVVGFPWLTALALQTIPSARSVVFVGLLPLSTALFGVLRGGDRPRPAFWLFAALGSATTAGFAMLGETGLGSGGGTGVGDALMLAAIVVCGLGYAEGAALSRRLGGWQVICWALLLSLPLTLPTAIATMPVRWGAITWPAWLGLGYVSVFSMLIGFVFWYRGLAQGGIARVGQLQLLQPLLGLALSAVLLGEAVAPGMVTASVIVIACVALARRFG